MRPFRGSGGGQPPAVHVAGVRGRPAPVCACHGPAPTRQGRRRPGAAPVRCWGVAGGNAPCAGALAEGRPHGPRRGGAAARDRAGRVGPGGKKRVTAAAASSRPAPPAPPGCGRTGRRKPERGGGRQKRAGVRGRQPLRAEVQRQRNRSRCQASTCRSAAEACDSGSGCEMIA